VNEFYLAPATRSYFT